MNTFKLRIITPQKVVREEEIESLSVPSVTGELTVLHNHIPLFTLLTEGICRIKSGNKVDELAIGRGYLEITGKETNLLVSAAYGQDEIDEKLVKDAQEDAKKLLATAKTDAERQEAMRTLRRSVVDLKLLKKQRRR